MNFRVNSKSLSLEGNPETFAYSVGIADSIWSMTEVPFVRFTDGETLPFPHPTAQGITKSGTSEGIFALYELDTHGAHLKLRTEAAVETATEDVYFTLTVEGDEKCMIEFVSFPAPFDFGSAYGDTAELTSAHIPACYTMLSRMQGTLVPAGTKIHIADGRIFERDGYMPIFGQVRRNTGYLAIYDTPYDARYELRGEDGGKVAPKFDTSLGYMAYPRKMLYRFMENCDYNDFAASYRAYVHERGRLVTLREKIIKNPRVAELIGCPIIHEGIATHISPDSNYYNKEKPEANDYYTTFEQRAEEITALHDKGLRKAYTHFDGWGKHGYDNLHPEPMPPHEAAGGAEGMKKLADTVNGCGYIFGIHDQYRDYYYDSPSFTLDNAVMYSDGGHPFCSVWYGGKHSFLCSAKAPEFVRKNYSTFEDMGIDVRGSYLDVFSVVQLDECFNPAHPVTRKECAEYRRECLNILTDRGIIPSSEETLDCILPAQVLCHHAPFFTSSLGSQTADAVGIPIPLFNLVYHDCVVIPWIGRKGSRGGWGIPKDVSGYAYAKLCGDPVYLSIKADEAEIAEAEEACAAAERVALEAMTRHEFLTDDGKLQRSCFANGETVTVNFAEE